MDDEDRVEKVIRMSAARTAGLMSWLARLQRNREGAPLPTVANALILFANDPDLRGLVAYNAFRSEHLILRAAPAPEDGAAQLAGPYPRAWALEDVALVQGYLQRVWSPKFARPTVEDAMATAAALNRFHPVIDWLGTLRWDGRPRVDLWLVNTFACADTPYHRAVGAKFLLAAVRRVRQPGCKFDHLLVLEGPQGIGKSTVARALFGPDWFSDSIHPDLANRDAAMGLLGMWCIEFAEIDHLIRTEVETIKAFLSRQVDRYRAPYGKGYVDRPRQGVLIGTTNTDDYLRDASGNRRIWPVRCRTASEDWVRVNRDQLWAEAAAREAAGASLWLDDSLVQVSAAAVQAERMVEDVWSEPVGNWLRGRWEAKAADVLSEALCVPRERQGRAQEMRVGAILRQLGWVRRVEWREGKTARVWRPPGLDPPGEEER